VCKLTIVWGTTSSKYLSNYTNICLITQASICLITNICILAQIFVYLDIYIFISNPKLIIYSCLSIKLGNGTHTCLLYDFDKTTADLICSCPERKILPSVRLSSTTCYFVAKHGRYTKEVLDHQMVVCVFLWASEILWECWRTREEEETEEPRCNRSLGTRGRTLIVGTLYMRSLLLRDFPVDLASKICLCQLKYKFTSCHLAILTHTNMIHTKRSKKKLCASTMGKGASSIYKFS
jgi:hypothetical protein